MAINTHNMDNINNNMDLQKSLWVMILQYSNILIFMKICRDFLTVTGACVLLPEVVNSPLVF